MLIYEHTDYKRFINEYIACQPKKGRGIALRLSEHLGLQQSVITSILKHDRQFTPEQALASAAFLGLDEKATEYLLVLVSLARSETGELKAHFAKRVESIRQETLKLKSLWKETLEISPADRGIFYSNWYYSAVRILTGHPKFQNVEAISDYLKLPKQQVAEILAFLVRTGLCVEDKGAFTLGPVQTSIDKNSEFLNNHRRNWREKAREHFDKRAPTDYFVSSTMVISEKDAEKFQKAIRNLIAEFSKAIPDSPGETFRCLNIDWFEF